MERMEIRYTVLFSAGETSIPLLVGNALQRLKIFSMKAVAVLVPEAFNSKDAL
jgi:hypothetical protein